MSTDTIVSQLRQRMIEDMAARKLGPIRTEATFIAASALRHSSSARPTRRPPTICVASNCI